MNEIQQNLIASIEWSIAEQGEDVHPTQIEHLARVRAMNDQEFFHRWNERSMACVLRPVAMAWVSAPGARRAPSSVLTDEEVAELRRTALEALGEAREDAYNKRDGKEADRIQREIEAVKRMTTDQLREWVRSDGGVG